MTKTAQTKNSKFSGKLNIDSVLSQIDNDKVLQGTLKALANDVFNNNQWLIHMHIEENNLFRQAFNGVKQYIEGNLSIFYDPNAISKRLNCPYIYEISSGEIYDIARLITIALAEEKMLTVQDYIDEFSQPDYHVHKKYGLATDKQGLVCLSDIQTRASLLDHCIDMHDGTRIYLHQFLRRNFSGNFVDTPSVLAQSIEDGKKVEVRIDPYRVGNMSRYVNIVERDYWYGRKFSLELLDDKNNKEDVTIHTFFQDKDHPYCHAEYVTIFRTSMLDSDKRQFIIEEYIPKENWIKGRMPGYYNENVLQRYAHFVYDQDKKTFEHVDCSVRVFDRREYDEIYEKVKASKAPKSHIGKRYKLLKISNDVSMELTKDVLYAFFRQNPHIMEYFCNVSYEEVRKFLER